MEHLSRFNEVKENSKLDIKNKSDIDRIRKLIKDQSMEWSYGQGTKVGKEREMVSDSFIEGANTVISLLKGDKFFMDMIKDY